LFFLFRHCSLSLIIPADENIFGDVEIPGARPIGVDISADILEPAFFDREAARTSQIMKGGMKPLLT
jgi:hypothetical protein